MKTKPGKAAAKKTTTAPRENSKKAVVIDMLKAKGGATLDAIIAETGWAKHTIRGFVSGMLGKRRGPKVESTKNDAGERCYKIAAK